MTDVSFGWLIRSVHQLERLDDGAHADSCTCSGSISRVAFKRPRELTWVTGVTMAVITVSFGVTGYSLPWDQVGYWAVKIVSGVPAAIPVVGDFMVELLRGGESVGQATLTRFYSLHTFVMPWLLAVFMLMHFLMIRKQGILVLCDPFQLLYALIQVSNFPTYRSFITTGFAPMHILKKPDLTDPKLRAKLAKGMGHNYYGEPAWPNDLLYIFPSSDPGHHRLHRWALCFGSSHAG